MVGTDIEYSAIAALLGLRFLYVAGAHVTYNIWSASQISSGTSYPVRVAALASIFRRLKTFAGSSRAKVALSDRHKIMLDQSWSILKMSRDVVSYTKLPGDNVRLRHAGSGREIDLSPREAGIAQTLSRASRPMASSHYALVMTETMPKVADDPVAVIEVIERLRRDGFLEDVGDENEKLTDGPG
jgi:hypothetical protein